VPGNSPMSATIETARTHGVMTIPRTRLSPISSAVPGLRALSRNAAE
jgi:hypothetical protein